MHNTNIASDPAKPARDGASRPGGSRSVAAAVAAGRGKTDKITRGESPPHKSATRRIGCNAARKPVGHTDRDPVDGTQDWTHYEGDVVY